MPDKVRVSLNFRKPDAQLVADAIGYYDGLKDNLPAPRVHLTRLRRRACPGRQMETPDRAGIGNPIRSTARHRSH